MIVFFRQWMSCACFQRCISVGPEWPKKWYSSIATMFNLSRLESTFAIYTEKDTNFWDLESLVSVEKKYFLFPFSSTNINHGAYTHFIPFPIISIEVWYFYAAPIFGYMSCEELCVCRPIRFLWMTSQLGWFWPFLCVKEDLTWIFVNP